MQYSERNRAFNRMRLAVDLPDEDWGGLHKTGPWLLGGHFSQCCYFHGLWNGGTGSSSVDENTSYWGSPD